ncbi:zinc finger protein 266-like isoform X2 [Bacillus rossius redtenbacheri]|uniref:zinc finger protein 266-like isoform X2 n=1 Tax=Bacillus rossius redtenbacheri TaxID=93214 RepID=UPI002FDD9F10
MAEKHANKEIDSKGRPVTDKDFMMQRSTARSKALAPTSGRPSDVICDVCGQEFRSVTCAIQHKFRQHPGHVAKHFCPHCGMQFPLKDNCDRHVATHGEKGNPAKVYSCPDCGVSFFNAPALDYHFKSTHKRVTALYQPIATPPPSKKIRMNNAGDAQSVYYCHLCGYEYIVKFNLQKHLERQHTQEERDSVPMDMIKCITCDALFYNKKGYDNHNMYHKPEDLYVTSEEQRLQTVTRVDQDFDIRRVQTTVDKFVPLNRVRTRPPPPKKTHKIIKKEDSDAEMSPATSPSSSSSDTDSDTPLSHRLEKRKQKELASS